MKGIIEVSKYTNKVRFQVPDIYRAMLEVSDWKIEDFGYYDGDEKCRTIYKPLSFTVTIGEKED